MLGSAGLAGGGVGLAATLAGGGCCAWDCTTGSVPWGGLTACSAASAACATGGSVLGHRGDGRHWALGHRHGRDDCVGNRRGDAGLGWHAEIGAVVCSRDRRTHDAGHDHGGHDREPRRPPCESDNVPFIRTLPIDSPFYASSNFVQHLESNSTVERAMMYDRFLVRPAGGGASRSKLNTTGMRGPVNRSSRNRDLLVAYHVYGDEDARERVIEENLPLVRSLAGRFAGRGEQVDDLVQVGSIGLIKSVDRFRVGRGDLATLRGADDRGRDQAPSPRPRPADPPAARDPGFELARGAATRGRRALRVRGLLRRSRARRAPRSLWARDSRRSTIVSGSSLRCGSTATSARTASRPRSACPRATFPACSIARSRACDRSSVPHESDCARARERLRCQLM